MFTVHLPTVLGWLAIHTTDTALCALQFLPAAPESAAPSLGLPDIARRTVQQLEEYLQGKRAEFDLPLAPLGTPFQQKVWALLANIPTGQTISYATLAQRLGDPKTIRAVGMANGANPIPIIIPCHRVVGSNGKLVGYSGELWRKVWLLEHERQWATKPTYQLF